MRKRIYCAVMAVMFYGLLQISSVNAQSPVQRPLRITGDGVLSLTTNEGFEAGVVSHGGLFENNVFAVGPGQLAGTIVLANGDTRTWTATLTTTFIDPTHVTLQGTITITGGTGKYEGATGSIEFEGAGTLEGTELHYTYTGEGWIKY